MKKISFFISTLVLCFLASCSLINKYTNDPWIGEWKPSDGNDGGTIELLPNGAVVYSQDSDDASLLIYGAWEKDDDNERTVFIQYDPSTIKVTAGNVLLEAVLRQAAQVLCSERIKFTVSEDGKHATGGKGIKDGFVKVSDGSGKYDDLKPHVYEAPEVAVSSSEETEQLVDIIEEECDADTCVLENGYESPNYNMGEYPVVMDGETIQLYKGNIGTYPIEVEYVQENEDDYSGDIYVEGRYKYVKVGNVINFSGTETKSGNITLFEVTANGTRSGRFDVRRKGNQLVGTFTNLLNNKEFDVTLTRDYK